MLDWSAPVTLTNDGRPQFYKSTNTSLPLSQKELYFLAEGSLASGTFEVSATAPHDATEAIVEIGVSTYHPELFDDMTTCRMHSSDSWGFGIFVRLYIFLDSALRSHDCRPPTGGTPTTSAGSASTSTSASPRARPARSPSSSAG